MADVEVGLREFEWIVGGLMAVAHALGGWFLKAAHKRLEDQDQSIKEVARKLEAQSKECSEFKVHVSDNYAKNTSLAAITSRIDGTLTEIQRDIKTLLRCRGGEA